MCISQVRLRGGKGRFLCFNCHPKCLFKIKFVINPGWFSLKRQCNSSFVSVRNSLLGRFHRTFSKSLSQKCLNEWKSNFGNESATPIVAYELSSFWVLLHITDQCKNSSTNSGRLKKAFPAPPLPPYSRDFPRFQYPTKRVSPKAWRKCFRNCLGWEEISSFKNGGGVFNTKTGRFLGLIRFWPKTHLLPHDLPRTPSKQTHRIGENSVTLNTHMFLLLSSSEST